MVNLQNRNRILKPVNEQQSHSSYGRLDINQVPTKAGTAASGQSLINNGLSIAEHTKGSSSGNLVKSSERLNNMNDKNSRKSYMMSPESSHAMHGVQEIKRKQTFTSSVDLKTNSGLQSSGSKEKNNLS